MTCPLPITLLACAALTSATARADLEASMALLEHLERTRVTVDAVQEPLDRVVAELSTAVGRPIRMDWDALDALGIDADDRVSLTVRDVSADTALTALTLSLGFGGDHPLHDVGGGQVVITTPAAAGALRCTDVYDLRALLVDDAAERSLRQQVEASEAEAERRRGKDESPHRAAPDPPVAPAQETPPEQAPAPSSSPAARLAGLILEHVDPEGWLITGGVRGRIEDVGTSLVVTATPRVHRQVRRILGALAAQNPGAIHLDAAIVTIDRAAMDMLGKRHEPSSAALARAVLSTAGASVVWRSAAAVAPGSSLTCTAHEGADDISFVASPQAIGRDGRVSIRVECGVKRDGAERRVSTTMSTALREGAIVADLGDVDGRALVVVAIVGAI